MRRLLVAAALLASACTAAPDVAPTTRPPTTTIAEAVTTSLPEMGVEIQDCSTPPVTFSPLCEIYDLLETWYVDAPIDAAHLSGLAVRGVEEYATTEMEEPPRTLICAIPDQAFTDLCQALARRVEESQVPVGPAVEAAMSHMIDTGLDPFTYYLPPGQTGAVRINGIVGGIGVVLDARDAAGSKCTQITGACHLEIAVVLEDNPGWEAGLAVGDVIRAVDGVPVEGRGFIAVVSLIAGDETGTVEVTIDRAGTEMTFAMERTPLVGPTVQVDLPTDDVGYLKIPDFELDIPSLVAGALADLNAAGPSTLVIDLRDNPGGYVDAVLAVADEFIDSGVMMISDRPDEHLEHEAESGGAATGQRLLVLVNQGTASAAEVLAGALRDQREAVIVGTNTFGKDAVQIPFTLRNGGEFYVAVARWFTPEGDSAGDGGLDPDREVSWPAGVTVDEIVETALEAAS